MPLPPRCRLTLLAIGLGLSLPLVARADKPPDRGVRSLAPGKRWEDAFVTGNGRLGAMLFGSPAQGTFVANHCRLFLPLGNREIVPDLAAHLPELRRIIRDKNYGEAMKFLLGKAKDQGFPGLTWTDKFHPGVLVDIRQPPEGEVRDYERTEDFATGEVAERWRDRRGEFHRRCFVSRTDNLVALSLSGPVACELVFPGIEHELIDSRQQTAPDWVTSHNVYRRGKGGFRHRHPRRSPRRRPGHTPADPHRAVEDTDAERPERGLGHVARQSRLREAGRVPGRTAAGGELRGGLPHVGRCAGPAAATRSLAHRCGHGL